MGQLNRDQLMPTAEQLRDAEAIVNRYRAVLDARCRILFVVPDYFETRPCATPGMRGRNPAIDLSQQR
jgi:pyrroloquinoline quinone biosynthesis protein E